LLPGWLALGARLLSGHPLLDGISADLPLDHRRCLPDQSIAATLAGDAGLVQRDPDARPRRGGYRLDRADRPDWRPDLGARRWPALGDLLRVPLSTALRHPGLVRPAADVHLAAWALARAARTASRSGRRAGC